jgi:diguanylate cyclase (GGDEF)-like protein
MPATRELAACLALADPAGRGLPAEAAFAALRAAELAEQLGRPLDRARAAAWRCAQLLRLGQHAQVLQAAPVALALLDTPALLPERCDLVRVLTLAACELGAFDQALDAAHELVRRTAPGMGAGPDEDGPALSAAFNLAATFERMGDAWQAQRLLSQALQRHGGGAPDRPLLVATNGLCAFSIGIVHSLLDTGAEAEIEPLLARGRAAGEQALAMLGRVRDPAYEVAVLGNLGELRLLQGDVEGAGPLLHQALQLAHGRGLLAHRWRVQASLGAWLLARGRAAEALNAMDTLLAEMGAAAPAQSAIRAHQAAYRACRALGRFEAALAHFEQAERSERRRTTAQLRAQSQLFVTRAEAQHAQWLAEQARADAQQQRQRAAEAALDAECDPLTGLGNRRHLERRCAELLPAAQREGQPLALVLIDIDHFKPINDRLGHATGDRVLVAMAQLLRENMRAGDVLARHGGEEFVVVLPGMDDDRAHEVCERLRERAAAHPWAALGGPAWPVTVSLGLAVAPPYELASLLQRADQALYEAKRSGRNRVCVSAA